jgi:hypothetical protein
VKPTSKLFLLIITIAIILVIILAVIIFLHMREVVKKIFLTILIILERG